MEHARPCPVVAGSLLSCQDGFCTRMRQKGRLTICPVLLRHKDPTDTDLILEGQSSATRWLVRSISAP
jgi:hypothetical protein